MASSSASNGINSNQVWDNIFSSYFRKTVSLRDWWLIKADDDSEGKMLAVAGFTCGEQQAYRVFNSAPISKRCDVFTLETADGITVILQGFINKNRTIQNGFPSEVLSHFLFGFPPNWEDYAGDYLKQVVATGIDFKNTSDLDKPTNNSENQSEENGDGLKSGITSTLTEIQSPSNLLGCVHEEVVAPKESLSKLVGDFGDSEQPSNYFETTMISSAEQTDAEFDDLTPSEMKSERGSNATLCNSGNLTCSKTVEDLKDNQKQKDVAELPMKHKNKQSPEVAQHLNRKGLKKCSHSTLHAESNIQQSVLKASRASSNSSDSLKNKENAEQIFVRGSSTWKARRRIIFDTPVESPRTQKSKEKTRIVSPESLRLRRSRSGRLLLPPLEFWHNQIPIYDADRNVTGIQEEISSSVGLTSGSKSEPKKQKKRR
ncbi:kinetochore-associated protein KNL-2 homolog [Euphorbia lathyris]|uniref:kinetochore-associated protein KNL-2 homolog n=1 Tax=Euphorbia lathyris TaxID=212925 RepID=UPI0033142135